MDNLHLAPAVFQQAIDAVADIRVTVVGEQVFAAIIHDKVDTNPAAVRDWRFGHSAAAIYFASYDKEFPLEMKKRCVELVKRLGLKYGAIDIVLNKKGEFWFLEINPNGQWAFIEEDTGQPIGKALAKLLEKGE